ncbi:undecaprenyl-phosphate glucose phosphotransferase [Thiomonas sp.]
MFLRRKTLREYPSTFTLLLRLTDALVIVMAGTAAYFLRLAELNNSQNEAATVFIAVLLANLIFAEIGVYRSWRAGSIAHEVGLLWLGWGLTFLLLTGLLFALKLGATYSRVWIALWFTLAGIGLGVTHIALRLALRWIHKRGYNVGTLCIIGHGENATRAIQTAFTQTSLGFKPVAWFGTNERPSTESVPTVGILPDLEAFMNANTVDEVWVAIPLRDEEHLRAAFHALRHTTANIRYIPDLFGYELLNHSVTEIGGMPMMDLSVSPMQGVNRLVKRAEDMILGSIFLLIAFPIMLLIAAGIKLTSPGPLLFKQRRIGWSGSEFIIYKFRTMTAIQEPCQGELVQATKDDPRVTKFGRFLRRTSLDELPQLINVIQGRMSLVGPRPHAVEHHQQYIEIVPSYAARHMVKPGITGFAQIAGFRGETDTLEKMEKRIEYDVLYIQKWSVWLDIKIIFLTLFKGVIHSNAY